MAITSGQINITPSAAIIIHEDTDGCEAIITNGGSYDVMLGNESVTKNDGFILKPLAIVSMILGPNEPVYGVANQGEASKISYLLTKNNN